MSVDLVDVSYTQTYSVKDPTTSMERLVRRPEETEQGGRTSTRVAEHHVRLAACLVEDQ